MKMSRIEVKKPSLCTSGPLKGELLSKSLSVLSDIMKSCYGPSGRLQQVHNGMGGAVIITSQSATLLCGLSTAHPALRVLLSAVRNHTSRFSDCGLFATILCCSLVQQFQGLNLPSCTVSLISRHLLNRCTNYLNSETCGCRIAVDFNHSKPLLCLAQTALTSKPACMLTTKEANYVGSLILKAFLLTVPNEVGNNIGLGRTVIVPVEGQRVMDSNVLPGLLIEMSGFQLSKIFTDIKLSGNMIKTALFCISLSGDFSDIENGTLLVHSGVSPEEAVLDQLINLGKQIINDQVGLVLCQKVIHPSLKQYFKVNHVIAVERVGATLMEPLAQMTGAPPIASVNTVPPTCYGRLKEVCIESLASKQFLHLISHDSAICSLLLCNRNGTSLDEMKRACETAQHVLQLTLKQPVALCGGGCTETHLASYLRYESIRVPRNILEDLNCSCIQYQMVAEVFCQSLESVALCLEHDGGETLTDMCHGHLWSSPPGTPLNSNYSDSVLQCGCGLYKNQEALSWMVLGSQCSPFKAQFFEQSIQLNQEEQVALDCFAAKISSLQVAVETANLLLDLSYIVEDQN